MELRLRIIRDAYQTYSSTVFCMGVLFAALIYFLIKNHKKARALLAYEILGILALATPVLANRLLTVGSEYGNHWLLYEILCAVIVVAYVGTEVLTEAKQKSKRILYVVCFMIALQFGVGFSYSTEAFALPFNLAKADKEVVQIADALKVLEEPLVIAPAEVATELKKYNKGIKIVYGNDVSYESGNLEQFALMADNYNCNCMVVDVAVDKETYLIDAGYHLLTATENYKIYTR